MDRPCLNILYTDALLDQIMIWLTELPAED
jgi:hypothetical protein